MDCDFLLKQWRVLTHVERRKQVKKYKRKTKRAARAAVEAEKVCHEEFRRCIADDDDEQKRQRRLNEEEHRKWMRAELHFRLRQEQRLLRQKQREEASAKLKAEQKLLEDRVLDELAWKDATGCLNDDQLRSSNNTCNPFAPEVSQREPCPYFSKVGACRFGFKCRSDHRVPDRSRIFVIHNMFRAAYCNIPPMRPDNPFELVDHWIESDEDELKNSYHRFLEDIKEPFGPFVKLVICCNEAAHLKGNVYVEYEDEKDAEVAAERLRGRWYDMRQIWPQFCSIPSWKGAVCEAFLKNQCERREKCNLLHVFEKNPT